MSQVTLTQILEVFDLLVKNQDPDGSRGLYTYLLTKPSATKRFELLVESAAAGRGLGDVAHCFETPIPHNTHVAHDVDPWDELAGYESAGDESGENEGQQGEEVEDETEGENAEGYNLDILEEAMLGTAEPEHDTAGELAEGDDAEHLDEEAVKNHELENSGDNEEASLSAAADAELQGKPRAPYI